MPSKRSEIARGGKAVNTIRNKRTLQKFASFSLHLHALLSSDYAVKKGTFMSRNIKQQRNHKNMYYLTDEIFITFFCCRCVLAARPLQKYRHSV